MGDAEDDPMVAALLREREGYARDGRTDRVDQVDEQLKLRGRAVPPKGRRSAKSETAD